MFNTDVSLPEGNFSPSPSRTPTRVVRCGSAGQQRYREASPALWNFAQKKSGLGQLVFGALTNTYYG